MGVAAFQRRSIMDQSNRLRSSPLGRLVTNALGELEQLGYSRRSLNRYRAIWTHLIEFAHQKQLGEEFSASLAARFVEAYRVEDEGADHPGERWRRHLVFGVKVLAEFAQHGRIEPARTDLGKIHLLPPPPPLKKVLRHYEQYCRDRLQLRPATLRMRTRELTIFLDFLQTRKARTLEQIQALDLSEFVSSRAHLKPPTVSRIVSDVRCFLRFLTLRGILRKDLSGGLPTIRVPRDARIPSVWDHELIVKLLGAIDGSSPKGKRDYAILLLAAQRPRRQTV